MCALAASGSALLRDFIGLVYPRTCEACGDALYRHEKFVCNQCLVSLPKSNFHEREDHELNHIFAGRVPLASVTSLYLYEKRGRVQRLLHAIKYHGQKELAAYLGNLFASDLKASTPGAADVIVPVPLHRKKLRTRGFNQSEWFAKGLAEGLGKPLDTQALIRTVETATQTRRKKYERWENVEGIFMITAPDALRDKHVLLVDDVITTGATIESGWSTLKKVPGLRLSVASIAFASRR